MNVKHLAQLAGTLSSHALQIVESPAPASLESHLLLHEISLRRCDAWLLRMQDLATGAQLWSTLPKTRTDLRAELVGEILVAEILTRVLSGLLSAQGQEQGVKAARQTGALLFNTQQEARKVALLTMVEMADAHDPGVRKLDKLRRLAERWTDILLGPLACRYKIGDLVFDENRAKEYGEAILPYAASPTGNGLFAAGLRVAFPDSLQGVRSHAGLHKDMAAAILKWLPADLFANDGSYLPLRSVRAIRPRRDAETHPRHTRQPAKSPSPIPSAAAFPKLLFSELRKRQQKP